MSTDVDRFEAVARTWRWQPVAFNRRHNGPQLLFRFANGYGASVVGEVDFDAWIARGSSPEMLREPMPILAGEVEIACLRWYRDVERTTGDWATAEGLTGVNGFDLVQHDWPHDWWTDSVARHVPLGLVEAMFESIERLPPASAEVEA